MKTIKTILCAIVLLSIAVFQGCGSSNTTPAVTMQKVAGTYYKVDINMSAASHYEVGRQYALLIKKNVPDYELRIDSFLEYMIELLQHGSPFSAITFELLNERAHDIYKNIPEEYKEEIQGMQSVFSYTTDEMGDGRLSQNKLLVFQLFADVARANNCSASAAFGNGTITGKTILGRSLEWKEGSNIYISSLHAVTVLHNGGKSLVSFGFLGGLMAISAFNTNKIFAATLDSEIYDHYPVTEGKRSYIMDLRYALENETTLEGVANYLKGKNYVFNFNIFLADENTAKVFEDDTSTPFSGLRTATSTLKTTIPPWNYPNAIAAVNWFTLQGTYDNSSAWVGNLKRWESFSTLYGKYLSQGKVNMDVMKQITGYPGPKNDGNAEEGAIFRYDFEPEMQCIIIDMDTLETWVFFQPEGAVLHSPDYIQVFSSNPFQKGRL